MPEGYHILERAQIDLDEIVIYGTAAYSIDRAFDYDEELHQAFERLVQFPDMGRLLPDREDGTRILTVQQHVIFYRARPAPLLIVRVVHQRANWAEVLSQDI